VHATKPLKFPQKHPMHMPITLCLPDFNHHLEKLDTLQGEIQQIYDTANWLIDVLIGITQSTLLTINPALVATNPNPPLPYNLNSYCDTIPLFDPPAPSDPNTSAITNLCHVPSPNSSCFLEHISDQPSAILSTMPIIKEPQSHCPYLVNLPNIK